MKTCAIPRPRRSLNSSTDLTFAKVNYYDTAAVERCSFGSADRLVCHTAIGVDEHIGNYKGCSDKVMKGFILSRDRLSPTFYHLTALLEHNVKVRTGARGLELPRGTRADKTVDWFAGLNLWYLNHSAKLQTGWFDSDPLFRPQPARMTGSATTTATESWSVSVPL